MFNFIKRFFTKKKIVDPMIGYWGVMDTETGESKVQGEMYSYENRWIPGPKIYDK